MRRRAFIFIAAWICQQTAGYAPDLEKAALEFLDSTNEQARIFANLHALAEYAYHTNLTQENRERAQHVTNEEAEFLKHKRAELLREGFDSIEDEYIKRQIKRYRKIGVYILPEELQNEASEAVSNMKSNYAKVRACDYSNINKCDIPYEGGVEEVMAKSRDPEELKHYWLEWYNKAGTPSRDDFDKLLRMLKRSAEMHGYGSQAEYWIAYYEDGLFERNIKRVYEDIMPFYKKLHGYVRYKLRQTYGKKITSNRGSIPMHLLGDVWGQQWDNILDITNPFPEKPVFDTTDEMVRQGYTPRKIFEMGDDFFQSMNMTKLTRKFWKYSMLERPRDGRDVVCHPSAWDMSDEDDVRIAQCTQINMKHFHVAHHELGHIQYFLQYQHQPSPFRRAPNPGFHEAVGDVIALSVSTPKHLTKIGLLDIDHLDYETRINRLFATAMMKVTLIPFAYWMDIYRYKLFRGEIDPIEQNTIYWKLRAQLTGVKPPVRRTNTDFDPPAKFHMSANIEYMRYFCSQIFQFQFYKAACSIADEYDPENEQMPLDNCDFYRSAEAGNAFKEMLALGSTLHWRDALQKFTGERNMSATALLEYFQPLDMWLDATIKENKIPIGWHSGTISAFISDIRIVGLGLFCIFFVWK